MPSLLLLSDLPLSGYYLPQGSVLPTPVLGFCVHGLQHPKVSLAWCIQRSDGHTSSSSFFNSRSIRSEACSFVSPVTLSTPNDITSCALKSSSVKRPASISFVLDGEDLPPLGSGQILLGVQPLLELRRYELRLGGPLRLGHPRVGARGGPGPGCGSRYRGHVLPVQVVLGCDPQDGDRRIAADVGDHRAQLLRRRPLPEREGGRDHPPSACRSSVRIDGPPPLGFSRRWISAKPCLRKTGRTRPRIEARSA